MVSGTRSVVDGAVRVLRALPESRGERQVAHLAELTGLPRPTVHRLLTQLRENDMVEWVDGRWRLAAAVLQLAHRVEPVPGLRAVGTRIIQNLRDHMTEAELIFTALAELSTRQIAESVDAKGMAENKTAAKAGGSIAAKARNQLESQTSKSVVTGGNFLPNAPKNIAGSAD